jgi:hypothetical protein
MTQSDDTKAAPQTPTEKLAALVAQRKAKAAGAHWAGGAGGLRGQERVAAARSASKSKPALRK